jgi:hypothetical protein
VKHALIKLLLAITMAGAFTTMAIAETKKISSPRYKGYMLDWCVDWGRVGCGKQASNRYCKIEGFKRSVGYKKWEKLGKPTRQIGTDSICDADYCDSFSFVMCER